MIEIKVSEIVKIGQRKPPECHFTKMQWCCGDSDDLGNYDSWFECVHCGHVEDGHG